MRWLFWLAWRELWSWRGRSALSLLALALSVGLLMATGSISRLMQASVAMPTPLLGRPADLWISSAYDVDYDLPAGLAAQAEAVPGVAEVQPVLRRPVRVRTPQADTLALMGVEPAPYFAFHELTLAAGALPSTETPGLVALAPWAFVRELGLGQPVRVITPAGEATLPIVGLIEVKSLATAQQGLVLYAPIHSVAELFGVHDAVTLLEVRLAPGASARQVQPQLERALGPAYVVSATSQPGQGTQLWQRLVLGALAFVDGLTLIGSASLVYAVFASATQTRRRQVGLLRIVGAERRQVMGTLMAEAILLGLIGGGLGLVAGLLFARVAAGLVLETGDVPYLPPAPPGWALAAVVLGVLSSLGGALRPAMRAAWQSPLAALQAVTQPSRPMSGGRLWKGLSRLVRPFLAEAHLAAAGLGRERGRTALMVGTLAFVLTMFLGSVGVLSLLSGYLTDAFSRLTSGDYLVLPGLTTLSMRELTGQDTSDVPPLDAELLSALEGLGDRVWLMKGTTANVEALQVFPGQPTLLLDIEGYAQMGGFRFQSGDWPRALETFRSGPAMLLTPVVARRLGVSLGEQVRLPTRQGPVDFDVAGIGESEFTTCILDLADGATYLGANEVNGVAVKVRPGGDARAVRRALLDAVQSHGGTLLSLSEATSQLRKVFRQAQTSISLLIGVTGVVAGLGVVNAMLASVAERRREIGMLRAVGATRRQVGRLILAEAAMLGMLAALIGTALGWAATLLFLAASQFYLPGTTAWWAGGAAWLPLLMASLIGLVTWPLLAMLGGLAAALHAAGLTVIRALYVTGE